jgi:hypothetical protein
MLHVLFRHLSGDIANVSHLMFLAKIFTKIAERRCRGVYRVLISSLAVDTPCKSFGGNLIQVPSS